MTELVLTQDGFDTFSNASSSGLLVKIDQFRLGIGSTPAAKTDTNIESAAVYTGRVNSVQALSESSVQFSLLISDSHPEFVYQELGVWESSTNKMVGRAVFDAPQQKEAGIGYALNVIITATDCNVSNVDVTIGECCSIPSIPTLAQLVPAASSVHNVYSVLNLKTNTDGSESPGLAMKYGPGGLLWGFEGYKKIFEGQLNNALQAQPNIIEFEDTELLLVENETLLVQAFGSNCNGLARKTTVTKTSDSSKAINPVEPFTGLDSQTVVHIWRVSESENSGVVSTCPYPPSLSGVPEDYVLTRGSGNCPEWRPPARTSINTTLYRQPGTLGIQKDMYSGDGVSKIFPLSEVPENSKFLIVSIDGVYQHKNTFSLSGNFVYFDEAPRAGVSIQFIILKNDLSQSNYFYAITEEFSGGYASYSLSHVPYNSDYILVTIDGFIQHLNAYFYDSENNVLSFSEVVPNEAFIEVTLFVRSSVQTNYNFNVYLSSFYTEENTQSLELPISPDTTSNVFLSYSGVIIPRANYYIEGSTLRFNPQDATDPVVFGYKDQPIEVLIFHSEPVTGTAQNNLSGVVVDAVPTSHGHKLLKHGQPPIEIPSQKVNIKGGKNISVSGSYPDFTINNVLEKGDGFYSGSQKHSTKSYVEDSEEIILVYPYSFLFDSLVLLTADFSVRLGPNFKVKDGDEVLEYSIGFRHGSIKEPPYNRRIKGTGFSGFNYLGGHYAYSNASISTALEFLTSTLGLNSDSSGQVDLVARARVRNADISAYSILLQVDFSFISVPKA